MIVAHAVYDGKLHFRALRYCPLTRLVEPVRDLDNCTGTEQEYLTTAYHAFLELAREMKKRIVK